MKSVPLAHGPTAVITLQYLNEPNKALPLDSAKSEYL